MRFTTVFIPHVSSSSDAAVGGGMRTLFGFHVVLLPVDNKTGLCHVTKKACLFRGCLGLRVVPVTWGACAVPIVPMG